MTTKYETAAFGIILAGETRENAIVELCNQAGRYSWIPFSIDYEKGIIFFTRKIDPDRETIENYA
jgi:hypothetical protein